MADPSGYVVAHLEIDYLSPLTRNDEAVRGGFVRGTGRHEQPDARARPLHARDGRVVARGRIGRGAPRRGRWPVAAPGRARAGAGRGAAAVTSGRGAGGPGTLVPVGRGARQPAHRSRRPPPRRPVVDRGQPRASARARGDLLRRSWRPRLARAARGRPADVHRLARRPRRAAARRARQRGRRGAVPRRPSAASTSAGWSGARTWTSCRSQRQENRHLGEEINAAGGECLLDMRVRPGGSHHQKFVVLRHPGRPELDVAFVGGIDLCHSRRDDADHRGDPQPQPMAAVYGDRPPWHDVQLAMTRARRRRRRDRRSGSGGTTPQPLSRNPLRWLARPGPPGRAGRADRAAARSCPTRQPTGDRTRCSCCAPTRTARRGYPFAPAGRAQRRPRLQQGARRGPGG